MYIFRGGIWAKKKLFTSRRKKVHLNNYSLMFVEFKIIFLFYNKYTKANRPFDFSRFPMLVYIYMYMYVYAYAYVYKINSEIGDLTIII